MVLAWRDVPSFTWPLNGFRGGAMDFFQLVLNFFYAREKRSEPFPFLRQVRIKRPQLGRVERHCSRECELEYMDRWYSTPRYWKFTFLYKSVFKCFNFRICAHRPQHSLRFKDWVQLADRRRQSIQVNEIHVHCEALEVREWKTLQIENTRPFEIRDSSQIYLPLCRPDESKYERRSAFRNIMKRQAVDLSLP